ncbi:MAG TPA: transglycosylase domain-containing protein [Candidatus Dormibacteraeota bacterium]|nr:transglycosylase domain-containing protein [Candidatus Dormibacteraeota bacterium]
MAETRPSVPHSGPGATQPPPVTPEPRKRASAATSAGWNPGAWMPKDRATWLRVIAVVAGLFLLLVLATLAYAAATLPDPSKLDLAAGTVIVQDRNGTTIEQRNAQGLRVTPVKLSQISPLLRNATIAVEDKNFYSHHGIDWARVIKAGVIDTLARRPEQGASTITEQLAKLAVLNSPKKSVLVKLREAMVATSLESRYTKDQILEMYLNTIYYGHHATGIEAASQVYFGKHASELNLAEASLLAGLPNGPSYYDPVLHKDNARARQSIVLDAMVRQNMITQAQADDALNTQLTFVMKENRSSLAPHFVDFVYEQLENLYGASVVNHGSFVVKTTLDLNLQKAAEHAVAVGQQRLGPLGADNGDFIAIDPKTGEILAMVGSADFFNNDIHGQFNVVTSRRQPGSSFKPYAYEQAFRSHKLTMGNMLDDTSRHFAGGQFHDFDYRDMGNITAHKALLLSRNIPALETMQLAGVSDVTAFAKEMGITSPLKDEVTTAIGSSEVRLIDHAVGYGVFATGGVRHDAVSVLEIRDMQGNVLDKPNAGPGKRVISDQEAYLITYILKDYASAWNLGWNKPFAGKSGTTNDYHDAWMMAYSPNLVMGAWVGNTSGDGHTNMNGVYGTMVGSSVLRDFINNGLSQANFKVESFQRPAGLIDGGPCGNNSNISPSPSPSPSPSSSSSQANVGAEKEVYLPGTQCQAAATSSPSASASTAPSIVATPSLPVCATPGPTPTPGTTPTPTLSPTPTPSPTPPCLPIGGAHPGG